MENSIESFTPWLIRRSERRFIEDIMEYSLDMRKEMDILEAEIECLLKDDFNACIRSMEKIAQKSMESTRMRKEMIRKLEQSTITPDHRGYLANIIYSLSEVGSYIHSASARLSLKDIEIRGELGTGIRDMMAKTSGMMSLLVESIGLLNSNLKVCLDKTEAINTLEEEIDILRRNHLRNILNDDSIGDFRDMQVMIEIINSIEHLSDKIDDSANRVEVVAMTHLP